jgi:WD40 repeat protein
VGSGHVDKLSAVSYAPNGEFIATVSDDCTLRLWREVLVAGDVTAICERLKCTHGAIMVCVTVSRNSEYVIAGDLESCLIYSAKNGNLVSRLAHALDSIYGVATSLNGYVDVDPTDRLKLPSRP